MQIHGPLAVAILAAAALSQQTGPEATGPDRIVLDVGTVLTGRIVQETDAYVEIEIAPGTVVGFDRRRTVSITRDAAAPGPEVDVAASAIAGEDAWYALVDADGQSVGWLHWTRGPDADGRVRYSEEWSFAADGRTTEVSVVEITEPGGAPVSCFAHERVRGDDGSFLGRESIVRARIDGRELVVDRRQSDAADRQRYPAPEGLRFPLGLADELRRQPAGHHQRITRLVFDPVLGDFAHRTFEVGRTRQVADGSGARRVRIVAAETETGARAEWVDAAARVLRREIRGSSLVALAATEAQARNWSNRREQVQAPSLVASADRRAALWLPNPGWLPIEAPTADTQVSVHSALDDAVFTLLRLDQFAADVPLPTVTDAVLRWLRLVHDDLEGAVRGTASVRGRAAERITARYADGTTVYALEVHVFSAHGAWFVTSAAAPRQRLADVRGDFDRMLSRLELRPEGIDPPRQGPFAADAAARR